MRKYASQHVIAAVVAVVLVAGAWAEVPGVLQKYAISPGDMLTIQVFGEPEMSGDYRVGPFGTIVLPLIGNVEVGGLRLVEIEKTVSDALRRVLRRPSVSVALNEIESQRKVYVSGLVENQGPILMSLGTTVADAVAAAGVSETGDLRRVKVKSADGTTVVVDISGLVTDAPLDAVPSVKHGDVIYVPKLTGKLTVLGEIRTPGHLVVPIGEDLTVLDAIGEIGGGLTERADRTSALVIRANQTSRRIDLKALLQDGDMSQNLTLGPGDVVVVLQAGKVSVLGEVNEPSSFEITEPITVLEALAQAGSVTTDADLAKGQLITAAGVVLIDLEGLLERGEMDQNMTVHPGDVVMVPRAGPETVLILGAVEHPGVINIRDEEQRDLLRLLTHAIPTPEADLQRACVYRDDGRIVADMQAAMDDGKLDENVVLRPDDIVMIPELNKIYVLGATRGERAIPLTEGLTLLDVVAQAADYDRGNMREVTVVRTNEEGESEFIKVMMSSMHKGHAPENVVMQEGDIVFIPGGKRGVDWGSIRNGLWGIGALFGLLGR